MEDADLTNPQGLKLAIEAGNALRDAMNSQLHPALLRMSAVQEQRKRFEKYRNKFSFIIARQLNNLFIHYGNHRGESEHRADGLVLPQHTGIHKELIEYAELMHWAKVHTEMMKFYFVCKNYFPLNYLNY